MLTITRPDHTQVQIPIRAYMFKVSGTDDYINDQDLEKIYTVQGWYKLFNKEFYLLNKKMLAYQPCANFVYEYLPSKKVYQTKQEIEKLIALRSFL